MVRASPTIDDPAQDAASLLRRLGFFGLFVIIPILSQVSRRGAVVFAPISVILLVIASAIDRGQRPVAASGMRLLVSPAFLAGLLIVLWAALSLIWTPFPGPAIERLANLVATIALTMLAYFALPDRMRSANLYLLPLGVVAAALVAIMIGLFGEAIREKPEGDSAFERGTLLLALLGWPAIAWLRSRGRDPESLILALLVTGALVVAPVATPLAALAIGALAFALTTHRQALGTRLTALSAALLLAIAPILPFIVKPIAASVIGPAAPGVIALKAWQKLVTSEPIRLITGHGLETALRGRFVNILPSNAPSTMLFELWYELGIVGAFAAAVALYLSIRRAARTPPAIAAAAMAAFAAAFTIGCIGVGLTAIWWFTFLSLTAIAFVAIERGQFRSRRPKASQLTHFANRD